VTGEREPATLIDRLVPQLTAKDDSPTVSTFLRGLAVGALVGAAIAGSALLQRRRPRDDVPPDAPPGDSSAPPRT